jgi:hypothetical protein
MPSKAFSQAKLLGTDNTISVTSLSADIPITEKFATTAQLPATGTIGEQAFVEETNRLYIWNGSGWYSIALINTSPAFDSGGAPESTYTLDSNGGTPITIQLSATDPEEIPIQWSYVVSDSAQYFADITQDSSVFTITAKSTSTIEQYDSAGGVFTITFKASDGVNLAIAQSEFTISFFSAPTFQSSNYIQINFTTTTSNAVSGKSQIDINYDGTAFLVGDHQLNQAKLYKKNGASWNLDHTFININSRNSFGNSVAMSDDTTKVVIGNNGSDSIDIFEWNGSSWQNYSITGPSNSNYGEEVSMSSDGTMIITGASYGDTFGSNSGEIYYIDKSSGTWINRQVIGNGSTTNLFFGDDCEISEDGKYIIGSKNATNGAALFYNSGTQSSPNFTKVATLTSRRGIALSNDGSRNVAYRKIIDGSGNTLYDMPVPSQDTSGNFGYDAAISDDGTVVVMGSQGYNSYQGAVIIFYDNDGTWESLNPIQISTVNRLGTQVAISGNGKTFASMGRDSANRWRLYVFES